MSALSGHALVTLLVCVSALCCMWMLGELDLRRSDPAALQIAAIARQIPAVGLADDVRYLDDSCAPSDSSVAPGVYATLLYGAHDSEFVDSVLVWAHALRRVGSRRRLLVLLASQFSRCVHVRLRAAGCELVQVKPITNPWSAVGMAPRRSELSGQFTKLRLWQLDPMRFGTVVYVDSDMLAVRDPESLFDALPTGAGSPMLAAAPDFLPTGAATERFNGGLLVLRPNATLFAELLAAIPHVAPGPAMEQTFLNGFFGGKFRQDAAHLPRPFDTAERRRWLMLPYWFNAPAHLAVTRPQLWDQTRLVFVHYVPVKPWQTALWEGGNADVYQLWLDTLADVSQDSASTVCRQLS